MNLTHAELVEVARRWLLQHHPIVITEMSNGCTETPDAIGWQGGVSVLVECKASRSDYYADKQKWFRRKPEMGIGDYRYFLAPKGMICAAGLPNGWGLLETTGKQVKKIIPATYFPIVNKAHELVIMASAMRRIGQAAPSGVSVKAYYLHSGDRASLTLDIEESHEQK